MTSMQKNETLAAVINEHGKVIAGVMTDGIDGSYISILTIEADESPSIDRPLIISRVKSDLMQAAKLGRLRPYYLRGRLHGYRNVEWLDGRAITATEFTEQECIEK